MGFAQSLKGALQARFAPYLLVIPIILFQALSLSGCVSTSPSLPDLYIVSFTRNDTSPPLSLRLGYLGICAGNQTELRCQPTAGSSAETILPALFPDLANHTTKSSEEKAPSSESAAAHALVSAALTLQSRIFIPLLAGAGVLFVAGLLLLALLKRKLARFGTAPPTLRLVTLAALCLSSALAFTACLATSEAAGALEFSAALAAGGEGRGAASLMAVKPGVTLQVLQWLAFGFTLAFTVAVPWLLRGAGVGGGGDGGEKL